MILKIFPPIIIPKKLNPPCLAGRSQNWNNLNLKKWNQTCLAERSKNQNKSNLKKRLFNLVWQGEVGVVAAPFFFNALTIIYFVSFCVSIKHKIQEYTIYKKNKITYFIHPTDEHCSYLPNIRWACSTTGEPFSFLFRRWAGSCEFTIIIILNVTNCKSSCEFFIIIANIIMVNTITITTEVMLIPGT